MLCQSCGVNMDTALRHKPDCTADAFGRVYPADGDITESLRDHIGVLSAEAARHRNLAKTEAVTDEARGYWDGIADAYDNAAAAIMHMLESRATPNPA